MGVENIKKYLQTAYSDERLAALLAHAQEGKLAYLSCCCFVGFPTADHSYHGTTEDWNVGHYKRAINGSMLAVLAQGEYNDLCPIGIKVAVRGEGAWDEERRARIIPIILEEIARRDALKAGTMDDTTEEPTVEEEWTDSLTAREMYQDQGVPK